MRRWNGWGEQGVGFPFPRGAETFLVRKLGKAQPLSDSTLAQVVSRVPPSRLPEHPLIRLETETRIRHARGQSLPDWLAMRSGDPGVFPDAVAYPSTDEDIRTLFQLAKTYDARVIPYGGGTSVVGHINPPKGENPVITVHMGRMNRLLGLDEESQIAAFGAGTAGPDVESQLRAHGYTLGHYPQSFEYSTLGGWIATRSTGQQSALYGRIEQLFAGGRLESPAGTLDLPAFPASAAGPDLKELVLGSEGRLGILTEAKVRISALPEWESFHVVFFPDWDSAKHAARKAIQKRLGLSMLRVSNEDETETQMALAGHRALIAALKKYLSLRGTGQHPCMAIFGITGPKKNGHRILKQTLRLFKRAGGVHTGASGGRQWARNRFRLPYLRNTLWERGYAVDTLETATLWPDVDGMAMGIQSALRNAMEPDGERLHVFTHLSHLYPQGASVYTTFLFRVAGTYEETLKRWERLKAAASRAIVEHRGTISHQHGVGVDHAPYLAAEKGTLGMDALKTLCRRFDPEGRMNPGKLIP